MELWALILTGVCSASAVAVSLLHQGIGQWCRPALGSSETSAHIPETLNALSLALWQLFQLICRGATTDSTRESLTATY